MCSYTRNADAQTPCGFFGSDCFISLCRTSGKNVSEMTYFVSSGT